MSICPTYSNELCVLKTISNPGLASVFFKLPLADIKNGWDHDCKGVIENCCFKQSQVLSNESNSSQSNVVPQEETPKQVKTEEKEKTKVSIHVVENPYVVKCDVLVYPANVLLNIDSPDLDRMTKGVVQNECDKFRKPIKMGGVYITSNGGELSKVQAKNIFHAVVSGESRLVNEEDIKSATRKSLHLAENYKARNVVMIPQDCGTHDINDTARVQLAAIKTYLQTNPNCSLANVFIVMEDQESFETYKEYYNRIFKK
jgi:O-acetyl-ADP-ribose deacetylase (regulator of RNase III)